jgi:hypothetical protein
MEDNEEDNTGEPIIEDSDSTNKNK